MNFPGGTRTHRSRRTGEPERISLSGLWAFLRGLIRDGVRAVAHWDARRWLTVLVGGAGLIAAMVLLSRVDMTQLRTWAHHTGPWFVVVFAVLYIVFTLFPLPRTIWTVAAGILFGPWTGFTIALISLTISAILAFSAVRSALGSWIAPRLHHPAVAGINDYLQRRGWVAIVTLRMVGAVPFSIVNYVAGLTPIPLGQFTVATALGSIPTTALGVFFGDTLTGHADPWVIAAMAVLAVLAIGALLYDAHRDRVKGHG